jgi:DnaK suppressor protein
VKTATWPEETPGVPSGTSGHWDEPPRKSPRYEAGALIDAGGIKPLQASMENNTRQGDMADQASGNNEVHIQLKLKQTDAKILQAIEEALVRIEKGTYGVCRDCGEPIAEARLTAIPWTRSCISCKEKQNA